MPAESNRTRHAMRPTLTLKKKSSTTPAVSATPDAQAEPVQPAEPAKPVEPAKAAKQSPNEAQAAKEDRAAANRLLNQEQHARRLAQWDQLKPLVDAYVADHPLFNQTVWVEGVECFKPLAIGIHQMILTWLREQPEALDCSNSLLTDLIKAALEPHVIKPAYLAGLLKFQDRFDLDGNPKGAVKDKHRARAEKAFQKFQQQAPTPVH